MAPIASWPGTLGEMGRATLRWLGSWWHIVRFGAVVLALALSSSSYGRDTRAAVARQIYLGTAPILLWFTVLSALISLIVIRIVVVTALSYGLSKYSLEMVVRVLVMELIPLTAALFAALRCTIPNGADIAAMRARGEFDALARRGIDPLQREVLPRVVAGVFAVLMLAVVSCVATLLLAYLSVYGATSAGFDAYTHTVGRVFAPGVAMIFALKILLFSLAVTLIPVASVLYGQPARAAIKTSAELQGLVRMFIVILLIEAASLVGNYY
jgi:phospholipid/cholesterol/gamma-HCH transport system permease protein